MKMERRIISLMLMAAIAVASMSCHEEDDLNLPVKEYPVVVDPIDLYIQANFVEEYGLAVRYKFVDRYVDPSKRVTPPKRELVVPMLEFLNSYWIEPYLNVPNGTRFFKNHVPSEMIFIGSTIYNNDGTVTLGTADAGARITITEVNAIDTTDRAWLFRQLGTIYHEFAHIVHQRYNLPPNFQEISPQGYTSPGSWYNVLFLRMVPVRSMRILRNLSPSSYMTRIFSQSISTMSPIVLPQIVQHVTRVVNVSGESTMPFLNTMN
jgi:hypothetical protein